MTDRSSRGPLAWLLAALALALALVGCASAPIEASPAVARASLEGYVRTADGEPVPGVRVVLWSGLATRWRGQQATTDSEGFYRFAPLESGGRIVDEAAGRWDFFVGITLETPADLESADGKSWWDLTVPNIPGHVHRRDFTLVARPRDG